MGMCLNKRVLIGLGVVALAVLTVSPRLLGAAGPLLLFAACPLSMVFMMRGMRGRGHAGEAGSQVAETSTPPVQAGVPVVSTTGRDHDAELRELQEEVTRLKAEVSLRSPSPSA